MIFDDLVIDSSYVESIKYLKKMNPDELNLYFDGVRRIGETLRLSDGAITTTEVLARELRKFTPEVFVNRNVASEQMVALSLKALEQKNSEPDREKREQVVLGYFSGSITHSPDFELISPVLAQIFEERADVKVLVVGYLEIPPMLSRFKDRVEQLPFGNWQDLPAIIGRCDINLVPIEKTVFNEAKSENKWVEAALVKVPTVASRVGPFADIIADGITGVLCESESDWYERLLKLISHPSLRQRIGEAAHASVLKGHVTAYSGTKVKRFIETNRARHIGFVLPSTNISGGVNVVLKHASILRAQGVDVTIISLGQEQPRDVVFEGQILPIVSPFSTHIERNFDVLVATLWTTTGWVVSYPKVSRRLYLVQNFETDFYEFGEGFRKLANSTYAAFRDLEYVTISEWCKRWLEEDFDRRVSFLPNGINRERFYPAERRFDGKIRILIEGDSLSLYKNVDEAFRITNELGSDLFEVCYLSYNGSPKDWYRVDEFLHKVPYDQVADVYRSCHILLKTSVLESFSYPPLEMMATGGLVVALLNDGNREYLISGENCLTYSRGDEDGARRAIELLRHDETLRSRLIARGFETADSRNWSMIEDSIASLYLGEACQQSRRLLIE